ncbi:MAG: hypothetical protein ACI87A_003834, partial [Planctomycetota bacterium]
SPFGRAYAPRSEPMFLRSRMRELRTSGSVGGLGWKRPRSTRPHFESNLNAGTTFVIRLPLETATVEKAA